MALFAMAVLIALFFWMVLSRHQDRPARLALQREPSETLR
jgi:hypothetical protein